MVSHTGIEPVTPWLKVKCSTDWANGSYFGAGDEGRTRDIQLGRLTLYQLSYSRIIWLWCLGPDLNQRPLGYEPSALTSWAMDPYGVPEEIRTPGPRLRRPLLYPTELQAHMVLLCWLVVSHTGIEPVTPWLKVMCSTDWANGSYSGAGDEGRTRDIQLGRLTLYQLSYSRIISGASGRTWTGTG